MPCKLGTKLFQESVNVWDIEKNQQIIKKKTLQLVTRQLVSKQNAKIPKCQKRTVRPNKRKGIYGNKKKTDPNVNDDVNGVYINNSDVNNDVNIDNTVVNNVDNTGTASERKVEMISTSTPSKNSPGEKIVSGNRIVDMEILSSVINMLICPSHRQGNITLNEVYKKKKGLASFLTFQCIRCKH